MGFFSGRYPLEDYYIGLGERRWWFGPDEWQSVETKWRDHISWKQYKLTMGWIEWACEIEWVIKNSFHFVVAHDRATRWMEARGCTEMEKMEQEQF